MAVRKQRLDKYYNLAKEKGYRARSAFKLLELNRKFGFLKDSHIAVDLCAAPGGWMQILSQEMPAPRKIIGIDLDPIKPMGDAISFVGDITTAETRKTLINLLDGHEVDIFVHDGAPNFGASKERDIFVQNDLVLHSIKIATEFLKTGGTFVSKIFRSENFCKIIKFLEEIFETVDVTKPLSSRNESAEIFAVCRKFKNPEYIDPRMFDSEYLFINPEDDIVEDQYKSIKLSDFIKNNVKGILENSGKIIVDFDCKLINQEFKEMFSDLKLLSAADLWKIKKLKMKIIKGIKNGKYEIPELSEFFSKKENKNICESEESEELVGIEGLNKELDQLKKTNSNNTDKNNFILKNNHSFFDDQLFDLSKFETAPCLEIQEDEEIEVSSCSEDFDMTESEMKCALMLKQNEDVFNENTIDRYMIDEDDKMLPFEQRPLKMNEEKMERKKIEVLSRKKARAMRRANKIMKDIVIEDEKEEAIVHKKVFKTQFKKERNRKRLVFAGPKGARPNIPKGRGKILRLDSRMKHDLYIQKHKKSNK